MHGVTWRGKDGNERERQGREGEGNRIRQDDQERVASKEGTSQRFNEMAVSGEDKKREKKEIKY